MYRGEHPNSLVLKLGAQLTMGQVGSSFDQTVDLKALLVQLPPHLTRQPLEICFRNLGLRGAHWLQGFNGSILTSGI